jgi:hypothetical protein
MFSKFERTARFHKLCGKTFMFTVLSFLSHKVQIVGTCVYLHVCSLIAQERTHRFAPNLACLFLETGKRTQKVKTLGKFPEFDSR